MWVRRQFYSIKCDCGQDIFTIISNSEQLQRDADICRLEEETEKRYVKFTSLCSRLRVWRVSKQLENTYIYIVRIHNKMEK
jgi:hypothetical protein